MLSDHLQHTTTIHHLPSLQIHGVGVWLISIWQQLCKYRKQTLTTYLGEYLDLLPNPDCCSDTEDNHQAPVQSSILLTGGVKNMATGSIKLMGFPMIIKLVWCEDFKQQDTLNTHHQEGNTINPLSRVCADLPVECHDSTFLSQSQHDEVSRLTLGITPNPSRLDNALTAIAEGRTSLR